MASDGVSSINIEKAVEGRWDCGYNKHYEQLEKKLKRDLERVRKSLQD